MNFRQLRYFCEVVDSGTLARAAERLHVAPTAISMQVSQLEEGLGGELFDRAVKPMALTALGKFFLPRAREVLSLGERLEQDARDVAAGRQGWLGIGFVRSLLYTYVPAAVRAFRLEHPHVKLELVELLSEHQTAQLRGGRIHIGLARHTESNQLPADLRQTVLFEDPFVAAISVDHPLAKRRTVTLAELAPLPLISYPKDPMSSFARHVLAVLHAAGAQPRVGHEAIEIHTALRLVAAGLGYAVVGGSVAAHAQGDLAFLRLPEIHARSTIVAVMRADEESTLAASMLAILLAMPVSTTPDSKRR